MSELPATAKVVIIGAGIVGNSLAYHLANLGWKDILLIDKGPLPNPGGSTGHASNFLFLVDHNKEMAELTLESARQYREWGLYTECGGIEVARTETRMNELRRRMDSATNWGIESRLISTAEIKELVPFIDESILIGGFYTPGVGVCDSLQFGTLCRERAMALGALTISANTEVTGLGVEGGRIRRVETSLGTVEAEYVVIACGVWSPMIAEMAGAYIPLTPAVHQMIDVGPVSRFEKTSSAIGFPIVRDMDTLMYERQDGVGLEIGSYAHRSILHDPEEIPSIEDAALSPTEFPFTADDFDPQMEDALALMPEIVGDESVGVKYAINGLIALTPDGMPLLGETPEVKGLWSAAAVWVKEGPAVGKSLAEWMVHGQPEIDCNQSDISRFHAHQKTRQHTKARAFEAFPKTYGIVHPAEQYLSDRPLRRSPMHEWHVEHEGEFFEVAGWERPQWFRSNAGLVERYGVQTRPNEWDARWWSPIINAEHLAMRDGAGIFDLSAFAIFDIVGPGALDAVQAVSLRQMDVPVGRVVYTPVLSNTGGFKSDLTIMRLEDHVFRVVTGGAHGMSDLKWFRDHLPADAAIVDQTTAFTTIGVWGPRARDIVASVTPGGPVERGVQVRDVSRHRDRLAARPRVADLVRRRPGLGTLCADGAGPPTLGRALGGRSGARPDGVRDGCLRHDRSHREGLPRLRGGARRRLRHRRGRHGARPGQGAGLRRPGGRTAADGRVARRQALHPHRRRPHLGHWRATLHARPTADRPRGRQPDHRRQGTSVVRDLRREQPIDRQARAAGLPPAGTGGRRAWALRSSTSTRPTR